MGCDRLTRLVRLLNRFRLEEFLEVWLTVKRALVALVIVHVELLATLHAPEAILVPDQTLGLCLFHLEHDLATAAAVRVRVAVLTHLPSNFIIAPPISPFLYLFSLSPSFPFVPIIQSPIGEFEFNPTSLDFFFFFLYVFELMRILTKERVFGGGGERGRHR